MNPVPASCKLKVISYLFQPNRYLFHRNNTRKNYTHRIPLELLLCVVLLTLGATVKNSCAMLLDVGYICKQGMHAHSDPLSTSSVRPEPHYIVPKSLLRFFLSSAARSLGLADWQSVHTFTSTALASLDTTASTLLIPITNT